MSARKFLTPAQKITTIREHLIENVRDGTGVALSRALSPAPTYSALSWSETSILFPSKFADISVKATAQQDDEKEHIRREKMAIEEIRGLLKEMLEG